MASVFLLRHQLAFLSLPLFLESPPRSTYLPHLPFDCGAQHWATMRPTAFSFVFILLCFAEFLDVIDQCFNLIDEISDSVDSMFPSPSQSRRLRLFLLSRR